MSDLDWFRARDEERRSREAEKLRRSKEDAARRGKENFDFERLLEMYDPSSDLSPSSDLPDPQTTAEELERRYYLNYPGVLTIDEFAHALREDHPFR